MGLGRLVDGLVASEHPLFRKQFLQYVDGRLQSQVPVIRADVDDDGEVQADGAVLGLEVVPAAVGKRLEQRVEVL